MARFSADFKHGMNGLHSLTLTQNVPRDKTPVRSAASFRGTSFNQPETLSFRYG